MNVFGGRPMLQAGALAVIMAVCGFYLDKSGKLVLAGFLVLCAIAVLALFLLKRIKPYRLFANIAVLLIGGGVLFSSFMYYDVRYLGALEQVGDEVDVRCVITDTVSAGSFYTNYEVRIDTVNGAEAETDAYLECAYVSDMRAGDVVELRGVSLRDAADFGEYPSYLSDGKFLVIDSQNENDYVYISDSEGGTRLAERLSARLGNIVEGRVGALASAMLLGEKSGVDAKMERDFSRSGVSHLLAISGLHLSIITAILGTLLMLLGLGKPVRTVFLFCFVIVYLFVIGFPISAVRAAIMLGIVYVSYFLGMSDDGLSSLGLAAWLILLISPASVLDYGFMLSFCATFGILSVTPHLGEGFKRILRKNHLKMRLELEADPRRRKELNKKRSRFVRLTRAVWKVTGVITVSLSVWLVMLLPVCYAFGELSLASVFSNLVLSVPTTLFLVFSILALAFGGVPLVGEALAELSTLVGGFIIDFAAWVSDIDNVMISLRHEYVRFFIIACVSLTVILLTVKLRYRILAVAPSLACLLAVALGVSIFNANAESVRADFLSKGDNDVLVMTSGNGCVICDVTGGSPTMLRGAYERAAENGATEVEALMLTHYHDMHASSVRRFMEERMVRRLWLPLPHSVEDARTAAALLECASALGVEVSVYSDTEELTAFGDVSIALSGAEPSAHHAHPLVCARVSSGGCNLMYFSSSSWEGERAAALAPAVAESVIVGAHGPPSHSAASFILPSAKKLYFAEESALDALARAIDLETCEKVYVNCQTATLIFD